MNVMTEAATTATKVGTATHSVFRSGLPNVEIPKFAAPKIEVPAAFRDLAQSSIAQAKDNYEKMQAAVDDMTSILEQAYATAAKGVTNYNSKLVEMTRANSDAAFEFACGLIAMKSLPEMVELSTEQARRQFDLITAQNKELWAIAERTATESAEPIKQSLTKAFNRVARS
jgi:phasin